jgi:secondary thiamine-phosphate synthase enzyme
MINLIEDLIFTTDGKGMYEITTKIKNWVSKNSFNQGQLNIFIKHTSASLTIMENASPDVLDDINKFFLKLVPEDSTLYSHGYEGNDDMPAHIKYMLTQTSLTIPIKNKQLILGTWQGIYLFEHRYYSHKREISLSFMGN